MPSKKERKICKMCGSKSVITNLLFHDGNFYHSNCLGTQFERCPITDEFMPKWKQELYNELRIKTPLTFEAYVQHKRHLLGLEPN